MTTQNKRTTIYLNPELHKALRMKAAASSKSVTELINDAVRESLAEDAEDNAAILVREKEPSISYDEMVKRLKKDGLL
jgi:predicted transcriptional regulator